MYPVSFPCGSLHDKYTISNQYYNNSLPDDNHVDCQTLLDAGNTVSGVYTIYPLQYPDGLEVYCNMNNGTGWMVSEVQFT